MRKPVLILMFTLAAITLSGCAPLIIGGAGVVVVDKILEEENGGDGLI